MAFARIPYEHWDHFQRGPLNLYDLNAPSSELRLCILTDIDLRGIGRISDIPVSVENLVVGQHFTEFLLNEVFGCELPVPSFQFVWLLCFEDSICWEMMRNCVNISDPSLMKDTPTVPFIVKQSSSGKLYSVEFILPLSPYSFVIPVNSWGAQKEILSMTLAEFYKKKYGVIASREETIFAARMGSPFTGRSLVRPFGEKDEPIPRKCKPNSMVYLLPEYVSVHPVSQAQSAVSYLPRFLFFLDTGLVVQRIYNDLIIESENPFARYQTFFLNSLPVDNQFESSVYSLLLIALTCPSANLGWSYEKLEWLGDAVWRYTICSISQTKEKVRRMYDKMMSNEYMSRKVSERLPYIHTSSVITNKPNLASPQLARTMLRNFNILADITEALIAVSFMAGGILSVLHTAKKMGLLEHDEPSDGFAGSRSLPAVRTRLTSSLTLLTEDNCFLKVGQLNEKRKELLGKEFPHINSDLDVL
jgi:dsRNA-specific ribonuclease